MIESYAAFGGCVSVCEREREGGREREREGGRERERESV